MKEEPGIVVRIIYSVFASGLVGACLWALGATIGEAVVDGAIFGIAMLACLSILRGDGLVLKVTGALVLAIASIQAIGFGITYALDGKGDPLGAWLPATLLAGLLLSTPPVFSRLGLSRRTSVTK